MATLNLPDAGEVAAACRWLRHLPFRHHAGHARDYLLQLRSHAVLSGLYRELFPPEYARSQARPFTFGGAWAGHTEQENEFLGLLQSRWGLPFPEPDDYYRYAEPPRLAGIPVMPGALTDWCCNGIEWEELTPALALAAAFCYPDPFWPEAVALFALPAQGEPAAPESLNGDCFAALCARETSPLRHFALLFDCLSGATGNIYLDTAYCQPEAEWDWNAENLRYLARDAARLAVTHQHLAALEDYVAAHPRRAARQLWRWWRQAASAPAAKRPATPGAGRPLVEILGAGLPDS